MPLACIELNALAARWPQNAAGGAQQACKVNTRFEPPDLQLVLVVCWGVDMAVPGSVTWLLQRTFLPGHRGITHWLGW
jgi:hypothetical protein